MGKYMLTRDLIDLLTEYQAQKGTCLNFFTPKHTSITKLISLLESKKKHTGVSDDHILNCFLSGPPLETSSHEETLFIEILNNLFPKHSEQKRSALIHELRQAYYDAPTAKKIIQAEDIDAIRKNFCPDLQSNSADNEKYFVFIRA